VIGVTGVKEMAQCTERGGGDRCYWSERNGKVHRTRGGDRCYWSERNGTVHRTQRKLVSLNVFVRSLYA